MTTKELHSNFILLHDFLYSDEPMKAWVRNDENYIGSYHTDPQTIHELIEAVEQITDTNLTCEDALRNQNSKYQFHTSIYNVNTHSNSKIEALYLGAVEFCKKHKLKS